jgi:3-oxoacid CoA-transferase subunit B
MDLVAGTTRVVVLTEHTYKDGKPEIVNKCAPPHTSVKVVDRIISDLAVLEVTEGGLVPRRRAPDLSSEELHEKPEPAFTVEER